MAQEPWFRCHSDLANKRVGWRCAEHCSISFVAAVGHLVLFWGALSRAMAKGKVPPDGDVSEIPDGMIERWAGWEGQPGVFATFVREQHCDGMGRVNESATINRALTDGREAAAERKRRQRAREAGMTPPPGGPDGNGTRESAAPRGERVLEVLTVDPPPENGNLPSGSHDVTRDIRVTPRSVRVTSRVTLVHRDVAVTGEEGCGEKGGGGRDCSDQRLRRAVGDVASAPLEGNGKRGARAIYERLKGATTRDVGTRDVGTRDVGTREDRR